MKRIIVGILIGILIITGCQKEESIKKEKRSETMKEVMVIINEKEYSLELEDNKTAKEFLEVLPLSITMSELNGNEKYFYLDKSFTTEEYQPKNISKGDVMLFGNNCLVIFYKNFETTYSYTKIGHINDLADLDNNDLLVEFK